MYTSIRIQKKNEHHFGADKKQHFANNHLTAVLIQLRTLFHGEMQT